MRNNYFEEALRLDVAGYYARAAQHYERAIEQGNVPVEAFANAAFIYWQAGYTFGFENEQHTDPHFEGQPWHKCFDLLVAGLRDFPDDLELYFLGQYFNYVALGEELSEQYCLQLVRACADHNRSLLPGYFLYLCDKERYAQPASAIVARCKAQPTAKHLWVLSIMQYN